MSIATAEIGNIKIKTNNYKIRQVTFEGKEHIVVPVIMMTEGVHNGSGGAVYHSIEELGHFPEAWNGIPVCIFHPKDEESYISANSPEVIETQTVGRIFKTHVDGPKLKAECWIDVNKIMEISPLAYQYILEMRPLEVSVGVFTDDEQVEGSWNGETYHIVAHNHRPDHLALLPGGQGACSWEDGAGIRANSKTTEKGVNTLHETKQKRIEGFLIAFSDEGYRTILDQLQKKMDTFDDGTVWHFIENAFDDHFIYSREESMTGVKKYFQRGYTMMEDGTVSIDEEAIPVARVIEYVPISANVENKKGVMGPMKVKAHIDSLISSGKFTEEDRTKLEALEEGILMKIEPSVHQEETATKEVFGKEEALAVLQETIKTPEQFLRLLAPEMQDQFRSGLKLHQDKKTALIEKIVDFNSAYTKEELKAHSMEDLTKLASFVPDTKPDYSLMGANGEGVSLEQPLIPVGVIGMMESK